MKKLSIFFLTISILLCACTSTELPDEADSQSTESDTQSAEESKNESQDEQAYETTIKSINKYGELVLAASKSDMEAAGFDKGDIVKVRFSERQRDYILPLIDEPVNMMLYKTYIDFYEDELRITRKLRNFAVREKLDGYTGRTVNITLLEKNGYKYEKAYPLLSDYDGDEEAYANFRNVSGGTLGKNALYRSIHPALESDGYEGRCTYADALAREHGIESIITLSQGLKDIKKRANREVSPYYCRLLDEGRVSAVYMTGDISTEKDRNALKQHLEYMTSHKGPYLVHCAQGKDRTGFVVCLLGALMGVDYDGIAFDYSMSFVNYSKIKIGSYHEKYLRSSIDDFVEEMAGGDDGSSNIGDKVMNRLKADRSGYIPPEKMDLKKCARHYMKDTLGLTDKDIKALEENLSENYD